MEIIHYTAENGSDLYQEWVDAPAPCRRGKCGSLGATIKPSPVRPGGHGKYSLPARHSLWGEEEVSLTKNASSLPGILWLPGDVGMPRSRSIMPARPIMDMDAVLL